MQDASEKAGKDAGSGPQKEELETLGLFATESQ